jgi:hypothetical protein
VTNCGAVQIGIKRIFQHFEKGEVRKEPERKQSFWLRRGRESIVLFYTLMVKKKLKKRK